MKRAVRTVGILGSLALAMALGGCIYDPAYYHRSGVVYGDGAAVGGAPVNGNVVVDADDDVAYAAPGYYYGPGYYGSGYYGYGWPYVGLGLGFGYGWYGHGGYHGPWRHGGGYYPHGGWSGRGGGSGHGSSHSSGSHSSGSHSSGSHH
jgi:hypothetical protein